MFKFLNRIVQSKSEKENLSPEKEPAVKTKYHTGLVLSGGGARGISHLGSVKALLEYGYTFDVIAGTSIGAIVGCILADGYHPDQILSMLTGSRLKSFVKTDFSRNGLMTLEGIREFLSEILKSEKIEDLPLPFIVAATNLNKGEIHYFREGNLLNAVIASASVPIVFPPVTINGELYVDGGLINNLPVRPIRSECDFIIGIHVNPSGLGLRGGQAKGLIQIAERTFHVSMLGNVLTDKKMCDLFIQHEELSPYTLFNFSKAKDIFTIGYEKTKELLTLLKSNTAN
ncbi:MAG: patatin-like phospholipase family protein [Candidatus Azobacteroides sp.]|nr:patatin-like phospholipase family protein [Candidatus Azobacteroides sp.]